MTHRSFVPAVRAQVSCAVRLALVALPILASVTVNPVAAQDKAPKASVAILNFTNGAMIRHDEYEALRDGVPMVLTTELAGSPQARLVERDQIMKVLEELKLQKTEVVDPNTAVRVGKLVGAQYFILGGFVVDPRNTMRLTGRVVNVETGVVELGVSVDGNGKDIFKLMSDLAQKLLSQMKLTPPKGSVREKPSGAQSARSLDALVLYSRAVGEKERGNRSGAIDLAKQALVLYPDFQEAKSMVETLGGDR